MTAVAGLRPVTTDPAPARAATAVALRQVRGGALVVTGVATGMSLLVAGTYRATVADRLDAAALAALAANPAVRTLFGEPVALTDPGGFTAWRTGRCWPSSSGRGRH